MGFLKWIKKEKNSKNQDEPRLTTSENRADCLPPEEHYVTNTGYGLWERKAKCVKPGEEADAASG